MAEITLSIIKADVGGFVGHSDVHPALRDKCSDCLAKAKKDGLLVDFCRAEVGDDIALIMTHNKGIENEEIHKFAWDTFTEMTDVAKEYGPVSYTHLRAHETRHDLVCRL